jgi:hypothetical protein
MNMISLNLLSYSLQIIKTIGYMNVAIGIKLKNEK